MTSTGSVGTGTDRHGRSDIRAGLRGWLAGHAWQLAATAALPAGGYMVITGALRLLD